MENVVAVLPQTLIMLRTITLYYRQAMTLIIGI